jgi:hypothetical protein
MEKEHTTSSTSSTPLHRMSRSVLLSASEDKRIADVARQLSRSRGVIQSKSAIMREAILMFVGLHEVGANAPNRRKKKGKQCPPKLNKLVSLKQTHPDHPDDPF